MAAKVVVVGSNVWQWSGGNTENASDGLEMEEGDE